MSASPDLGVPTPSRKDLSCGRAGRRRGDISFSACPFFFLLLESRILNVYKSFPATLYLLVLALNCIRCFSLLSPFLSFSSHHTISCSYLIGRAFQTAEANGWVVDGVHGQEDCVLEQVKPSDR